MQGARLATFCDTLPSSKPASCPRQRRPTTIASSCSRRAVSMIPSAGSPQATSTLIVGAPICRARSLDCKRIWFEMASSASPRSLSAPASGRISSLERFPPTVGMESSPPKVFASWAATSSARSAPWEPSLTGLLCRRRIFVRFLPALGLISSKLYQRASKSLHLCCRRRHMHTQVTRAQFKIKDATVVHSPAGAEFIPQAGDQSLCGRGTSVGSCPAETSIGTATCSI